MIHPVSLRVLGLVAATAVAGCASPEMAQRSNAPNAPQTSKFFEPTPVASALSREFRSQVPYAVHFNFDSDALRTVEASTIAEQAAWILEHPGVKFSVTGHTDKVGNQEYNMDLGMRRAERVVAALVSMGVSPEQLEAMVTMGEDLPVVNTENRELANRRTVTDVLGLIAPEEQAEVTSRRDRKRRPLITVFTTDDGEDDGDEYEDDYDDESEDGYDDEGEDEGNDDEGEDEANDDEGEDEANDDEGEDEGEDEGSDDEGNGNNGHGNDDDGNDDSNPGNSNDENDDDGKPGNGHDREGRGNNGHGNDEDGNDDSNPGKSNDENDDTDDDGSPGRSNK